MTPSSSASSAPIESVLIEKKRADFTRLAEVVAEYRSRGARSEALNGDVLTYMPKVVSQATGVPLFMFLDPCGANVPFDELTAVLGGPRSEDWPPTEVLLNFSADLTRRAAGALKAGLLSHDSARGT